MIARMRKVFNRSDKLTNIGWLAKLLLMVVGIAMILSVTGCKEHFAGVLNPKGVVTYQERKLLFDTLALMLIVVIPVIIMSFTFVYHYQISHRITDYKPNWSHSLFLEIIWWGIPCVIILILAVVTWKKSHELDPYNRIAGHNEPPMIIEVIALPWKWLFIYPQQGIATVNYLVIPVGQQVEYWMTADNVAMSAFFIPQLGSQIYTMAGMRTRLHLVGNEVGVYEGLNTQYNGNGFSDMHFAVHVVEPAIMQQWVTDMKKNPNSLSTATYNELLVPSMNEQPKFFAGVDANLFSNVISTYMHTFGNVHPRANIVKNKE